MSLVQPLRALPPERRRALAIAAGIVLGCVVLSFVLAYVTGNGTWFIAWWPPYAVAILVGRYTGWLWGPLGRRVHARQAPDAQPREVARP